MRKHTLLSGIGGVRSAILILSSLIIAAIGVLQAPPCSAAEADDVNSSAVATHASAANEAAALVRVSESYGKLPLSFEANRGQTDPEVKFLARSTGHMLFLASTEAVLVFTKPEYPGGERRDPRAKLEKPRKATQTVLRMTFLGANLDARVTGREELPGKANYFIGNDPAKWRTNVPTYAKVHSVDLYPGIDLVFYGNQRQLEYDFVVHPGDDPSSIALSFQGADKVEVDAQGDLVLHMAAGAIRQRKPVIYQEVEGARREIAGGYVLKGASRVELQVAAYDRSLPLIIDPVLFYSTYLGGSGDDGGDGNIAVDTAGDAYVTGRTNSTNIPTTTGSFQPASGGQYDAFVTKLNPTGSGLVYSTYLGGSNGEEGYGIAVDTPGNAYVTGITDSNVFSTTPGALPASPGGGGRDAPVTH